MGCLGFPGHDSSGNIKEKGSSARPRPLPLQIQSYPRQCLKIVPVSLGGCGRAPAETGSCLGFPLHHHGQERCRCWQRCRGVAGRHAAEAVAAASAGEDRRQQKQSSIPNCLLSGASTAPRLVTAWESCKSLKADFVIAPHWGKPGCSSVGDPAQTFPLLFCDFMHPLAQLLLARETFTPPKYEC